MMERCSVPNAHTHTHTHKQSCSDGALARSEKAHASLRVRRFDKIATSVTAQCPGNLPLYSLFQRSARVSCAARRGAGRGRGGGEEGGGGGGGGGGEGGGGGREGTPQKIGGTKKISARAGRKPFTGYAVHPENAAHRAPTSCRNSRRLSRDPNHLRNNIQLRSQVRSSPSSCSLR